MKKPDTAAGALLRELDALVREPYSRRYIEIRADILQRMRAAEARQRNPFNAGAPAKYDDEFIERIKELRRRGEKTRAIAEQLGCSQSTVSRLLNRRMES